MELSTFDILLLFAFAIAISFIMGMNVLNIIDKNLADIKINVPQPICPKPVCPKPECPKPSCLSDKYIDVDNFYNPCNVINSTESLPDQFEQIEQIYQQPTQKIEGFSQIKKFDNNNNIYVPSQTRMDSKQRREPTDNSIKPLITTADQNEKTTLVLRQGYNSSGADTPNIGDAIMYPAADDIIRYNGYGCYQDIDTRSIRKVKIDSEPKSVCKPCLAMNRVNTLNAGFLTADGKIVDQHIKFDVPKLYMGIDPYMRGVSYANMSIESPADIDQIGSIPVNNYDGEPVPLSGFMDN